MSHKRTAMHLFPWDTWNDTEKISKALARRHETGPHSSHGASMESIAEIWAVCVCPQGQPELHANWLSCVHILAGLPSHFQLQPYLEIAMPPFKLRLLVHIQMCSCSLPVEQGQACRLGSHDEMYLIECVLPDVYCQMQTSERMFRLILPFSTAPAHPYPDPLLPFLRPCIDTILTLPNPSIPSDIWMPLPSRLISCMDPHTMLSCVGALTQLSAV